MKNLFILLLILSLVSLSAQDKKLIEWKNLQEGDSLQIHGDNRLLFVDIFTDWCGPCKFLDKYTFQNQEVSSYINENFIPVKFNAELKESITFKGNTYDYISNGQAGIQSWAYYALEGNLRYPSMALINKKGETVYVISGFMQPDEFLKTVKKVKSELDQDLAKDNR
jgi:thioredoxin-related protein